MRECIRDSERPVVSVDELLMKLDALYGELRDQWARGDLSLEDIARIQLETMFLIGQLIARPSAMF